MLGPRFNPVILTTILFLSSLGHQCYSQQTTPPFESISTSQGLSQGMVFDILQDQDGFIWVGTKNGLNRYDGYGFKVFSNDPYNIHTLSSNTILKLLEDSKGNIWVGTEDAGLNIYNKTSGQFYRIVHKNVDPLSLSGNHISLLEEMPDGRMLVAVAGAGLNIIQLNADFYEKNTIPAITRISLPNNVPVYGMGKDADNNIWVGDMNGVVYRFDAINNSFIPLPNGQLLNNGYFTQDESVIINGNLFLNDGKKIIPLFNTKKIVAGNLLLRPKTKLWENYHRETYFYDAASYEAGKEPEWTTVLPSATRIRIVYPFIIDRSGILWSGSVGYGLRKYNIASSKFKTRLSHSSVRWIVPDARDSIIWGDYGYGWRTLREDTPAHSAFSEIPSVTQIDNILISKTGDYYLKSDNKGYFKYKPETGQLTAIPGIHYFYNEGDKQPMLEDSKGNIWFSGLGGKFARLNPGNNSIDSFSINTDPTRPVLPKTACTSLYEDIEGVMWIGTQNGFAKLTLNAKSATVKWYYNDNLTRNSLNYNHVSCFMDDPREPGTYIWICTKGGGLNRLNKNTGDFFHLTNKDGLPDNVVYGILADDFSNIWGSTNNGIFCLLAKTNTDSSHWVFRNFTKAYGLQDDEFNTGSFAKLHNGNLAFGGVNGLNIFDPKEILAGGFTPNVFITNILINNLPVTEGDNASILKNTIEKSQHITLNHLQDILTLEFSSLDFTAPVQNKYRYQLVGLDNNWVESGTRRSATYLHLPSGSYTFNVQGSNSQGIWSDNISSLQITILPPWWRSWWAYLLYVLIIALLVRAYFKFSINRAKLQSQLKFEQEEARRIKELDTAKTQLYTNITHEFRTPLTVILGMAQQVANKPAEQFGHGMDMIIRNGESLLKLVNEMLDLSKLETGKMQLQIVNGDIIAFLRYIVESFHSLAESQHKQLHFLTEIDELSTSYDPEKMRQIVSNLLSNAIKFTPEKGNIYISVSKNNHTSDSKQVTILLKVKDTGIGVPEGQLEHIFDRFYQLDNSTTRKAEGTGIGLSLTKELVKLMGGDITVKSPPTGSNKGTEFTVALPLIAMAHLPEAQPNNKYPSGDISTTTFANWSVEHEKITERSPLTDKPLILLVEDNTDVVAYTASCLTDYRLAVGKDGREGLDIATDIVPDLIITDVMMPFMDGFELCERLRRHPTTSHIPIIILTARIDMDSRIEGLKLGADAYLDKPFHREELLTRIKKLLELRQHLQEYYLNKSGLVLNNAYPTIEETPKPQADDKTEHEFVTKVRSAIEVNLANGQFTVEHLSKLVYMSHSQLHRKLEALTGCSPNKFIRIIRLNKAKELLKNPSSSIASVALDCGFNDPGYFARIFKQEYGETPQVWKSAQLKN